MLRRRFSFDPAAEEAVHLPAGAIEGRTLVDTVTGPMPAEDLRASDMIPTFDDGPQRLRSVERNLTPERGRMLLVREGVIGNARDMLLSPDQLVIVESDAAERLTGSPFAVLPAHVLEGIEGVRRARAARARGFVTLQFGETRAITVSGGAVMVVHGALGGPDLLSEEDGRYAPLPLDLAREVAEWLGASPAAYAAFAAIA